MFDFTAQEVFKMNMSYGEKLLLTFSFAPAQALLYTANNNIHQYSINMSTDFLLVCYNKNVIL